MTEKRLYVVSATNLPHIRAELGELQIGDQVRVGPPDRLLVQNARFHAMCGDVAKQAKYLNRNLTGPSGRYFSSARTRSKPAKALTWCRA